MVELAQCVYFIKTSNFGGKEMLFFGSLHKNRFYLHLRAHFSAIGQKALVRSLAWRELALPDWMLATLPFETRASM